MKLEPLRLETSRTVGLSDTSPSQVLHVVDGSDVGFGITDPAHPLQAQSAGREIVRVTAAGEVIITDDATDAELRYVITQMANHYVVPFMKDRARQVMKGVK